MKRRILIRAGMLLAVLALIVMLPAHLVVGQMGGSQSTTVTVTAVPGFIYTPPGGGGGGGGGIGGGGTPPPTLTVTTPSGPMTMEIASDGTLLQSCTIADPSGNVLLGLDSGTRILCSGNQVPERLEMRLSGEPLPVPEGMAAVSPIYDLTAYISGGVPQPVVFDPPLRLQINYDPEGLPENTTSVFIAYYDAKQGWIPLEAPSGFVAAVGTAEAQVNHFTPFAVIAELTPLILPAHFELHNLDIKPNPVRAGESITISAQLVNTGGLSGEYTLMVNIKGLLETSQVIQLTPGQSQEVSFILTPGKPGSYQIEIGDLRGNLVVETIPTPPTPPTPTPPAPAVGAGVYGWLIPVILAGAAIAALAFIAARKRLQPVPAVEAGVYGWLLPSVSAGTAIAALASTTVRERLQYALAVGAGVYRWLLYRWLIPIISVVAAIAASAFTTARERLQGVLAVEKPSKPAKGAFRVSNLKITPSRVKPARNVTTIIVEATNTGSVTSSYSLVLKIKGVVEAVKEITLGPGQSQKVAFAVLKDKPGVYDIDLEGLKSSFTVEG